MCTERTLKFFAVSYLLLIFNYYGIVESAKILGVFMGHGRAHYVMGNSLMKCLAEAGHEVTLISRYGGQNQGLNYKEIPVNSENQSDTIFEAISKTKYAPFHEVEVVHQNSKKIIKEVFENENVKALINTATFDLVIVEQMFTDALKVFAWHFNAHLIVFHPFRADSWVNSFVGNPNFPAYVPEYLTSYTPKMAFFERLENVLVYLYDSLFKEFEYLSEQNDIVKKYFPDSPDLSEIAYNTSLVLLNSDVALNQPIPKVPNMIDIGGFHIVPPRPLPADVINFIDNSIKGVVYVNLDVLTSSLITEERRNSFIKILSNSEYDFLWQWDEERVPDQPPNLLIRNSFSQQDVLAHPKIKLFLHLGEPLSILEGVYYGVPQLLFPLLGDHIYSAAEAKFYGYAWAIPFPTVNEYEVIWALHELLENPKYHLECQRRSKLLKEKLVPPKKLVTFWVDYILQTDGAKHLRVESLKYSWYQLLLLDIVVFILGLIILIPILIKFALSYLCKKIGCAGKTKDKGDYFSVAESDNPNI